MKEIAAFLAQAVAISLTGVMQPGPMTAAGLAAGARRKHAGLLLSLGHAVVEFPLMVLLMVGLAKQIQRPGFQIAVSLGGGAMLLFMAAGALRSFLRGGGLPGIEHRHGPVLTGIVFTAGNPLFLAWWATTGLALTCEAAELGVVAFGLFAVVHWVCDLVWLEVLSVGAFQGSKWLGGRSVRIIALLCAAVLLAFGVRFLVKGLGLLLG